jgi:hypothetical protein|tara:strand:+ start:658 stop:849 length:192 start_codon:yes stop_codon:yes gene_type:complete
MPIKYKNLTLAILMSKRQQTLRHGLLVIKHKLNNKLLVPVSDKKSIVLYKKTIGDNIVDRNQG